VKRAKRLSDLHPALLRLRTAQLVASRQLSDGIRRPPFARVQLSSSLPVTVVNHQSRLRRSLAGLDPRYQETKIVNLGLAARSIDGLLIRPGELFSFWNRVGNPTEKRGFAPGLVLSHGEVSIDVGGGLCQMSNLLYWMALHTPLTVAEQHHHGFDPFPDDDRVQPFGSGASVFYNYGDLRLLNATDSTFQLSVRLTDTDLVGAIRSDRDLPTAFVVEERGHRFSRSADGRVYRDNELWQTAVDRATGANLSSRLITRNHALVKYPVPDGLIDA
jgi:vancomycin resistance protein VanW